MTVLQDNQGNLSSARIMALPTVFIGCGVVVSSVVAMFRSNPDAIAMAGIGVAMITVGLGVKAISKKLEGGQ